MKKKTTFRPDKGQLIENFSIAGALRALRQNQRTETADAPLQDDDLVNKFRAILLGQLDTALQQIAFEIGPYFHQQVRRAVAKQPYDATYERPCEFSFYVQKDIFGIRYHSHDASQTLHVPLSYPDLRMRPPFEEILTAAQKLDTAQARLFLLTHDGWTIDIVDTTPASRVDKAIPAQLVVRVDPNRDFDGDTHYPVVQPITQSLSRSF